jgi:hypothetical protein
MKRIVFSSGSKADRRLPTSRRTGRRRIDKAGALSRYFYNYL